MPRSAIGEALAARLLRQPEKPPHCPRCRALLEEPGQVCAACAERSALLLGMLNEGDAEWRESEPC